MKILFSAHVPADVLSEYRPEFELCIPDKKLSCQETLDLVPDCDAYMILTNKGDKALLDATAKLKAIANLGVGYDNIDWLYATEKGIAVINTPTQVTDSTVKHTIALLVRTMRCYVHEP